MALESILHIYYPEYVIVPFSIGQMYIRGLQVTYLDGEDCTINEALFNQELNHKRIEGNKLGDLQYGQDQWLKNTERI